MSREAPKPFRLSEISAAMRVAVLMTLATVVAPAQNTQAFNLTETAQKIAEGKAAGDYYRGGGSMTIKCREPGEPLFQGTSGSPFLSPYNSGNAIIYVPADDPRCRDNSVPPQR